MKLKININFIEKYLAYLINDIEYKRITKKLKKYDLLADVDDQRFHHFRSVSYTHLTLPKIYSV